jgi:hypothetical protein
MIVSQAYASVLKYAPDRRIEFACNFRLRFPNRLQNGDNVEGRNLMHGRKSRRRRREALREEGRRGDDILRRRRGLRKDGLVTLGGALRKDLARRG